LLDEPTNHLDLEMRLALNQALQGFEGSVILVSHDRHLLRSVCDDLWLVDGAALRRFEQDVDFYPAWLAQRKSRIENPDGTVTSNHQLTRRQLKSQQNQLKKLEKEITELSATRDRLELELGDSAIYEADNREALNTTLGAQAENQKRLDQVEEDWLNLSEIIEAIQ
jgi:ATP-binding cassette subfamily F protein 3